MLNGGDRLAGFAAQSLGGAKTARVELCPYYLGGAFTFTVSRTGYYKFVLWGAGGNGHTAAAGGGSGAYCEYTRALSAGQAVIIVAPVVGTAAATTITFADGKVVSAGNGASATVNVPGSGGVASGGDVNINGSSGGSSNGTTGQPGSEGGGTAGGTGGDPFGAGGGGAGAPANLPYIGAAGVTGANSNVSYPGPGAGGSGGFSPGGPNANATNSGGPGVCLVQYLGAQ